MARRRGEKITGRSLRAGSTHDAVRCLLDGRGWGLRQRWGRRRWGSSTDYRLQHIWVYLPSLPLIRRRLGPRFQDLHWPQLRTTSPICCPRLRRHFSRDRSAAGTGAIWALTGRSVKDYGTGNPLEITDKRSQQLRARDAAFIQMGGVSVSSSKTVRFPFGRGAVDLGTSCTRCLTGRF